MNRFPTQRSIRSDRPTLGVIDSISTGFEAVLRHPWLTVVPIALDLFLWLGPRLQATALYDQIAPNLQSMSAGLDADSRLAMQQIGQGLHDFFNQFNLFSWLSVGPLGVPSLNAGSDATTRLATGAAPLSWQVTDFNAYFLLVVVFGIIGLFLGGLFWAMLTDQVQSLTLDPFNLIRQAFRLWLKLLAFVAIILLAVLALLIPISFVTVLISTFSAGLASLVPALALSIMLWGVFYLVFTVHGLALYQMTVQRAMRLSTVIARVYFLPTLGLATVSIAIYLGIGLIWDSLALDSWARLIAIVGNAFIATSLYMASLLYYQNRSSILLDYFSAAQQPVPSQKNEE